MKENSKKFRLDSKSFYLTYPQSGDLTRERVLEHFQTFPKFDKYLISKELHKDGEPHIHALLLLHTSYNLKDERAFDIDGHHPNIQPAKRRTSVEQYITKDGEYITNYYKPKVSAYSDILDPIIPINTAMATVSKKHPRDVTMNYAKILETAKRVRKLLPTPDYTMDQFNQPPQQFEGRSNNLLIWGPGGLGKTEYARAHFLHPLVVDTVDDLKHLTEEHDGVVWDDWDFTQEGLKWPATKVIKALETNREVTLPARYYNATLPAGRKQIFTSNKENPFTDLPQQDPTRLALETRVKKVEITDSLFNKTD